jgi:hypothetical protein
MTPAAPGRGEPAVAILGLEHPVDGYLHGLGQTYLQARLRVRMPESVDWAPIDAALAGAAPDAVAPAGLSDTGLGGALERLVNWTAALQRAGGDGVFEGGRLLAQNGDLNVIALPTLEPAIASLGLRMVAAVINAGAADGGVSVGQLAAAVRSEAGRLPEVARRALVPPATRQLLAAARRRGVPWLRLGQSNAFQLGYGARSRSIGGGVTHATDAVADEIIAGLVEGDGRIPLGLVVGARGETGAVRLAARMLGAAGLESGVAAGDGARLGDEILLQAPADVFAGARTLLGDARVEAALVAVDDPRPAATGLPFDRCSALALASSRLAGAADGGRDFAMLARSVMPMNTGQLVINADDGACMAFASQFTRGRLLLYSADSETPWLLGHRAKGGWAVWVEAAREGLRLNFAGGPYKQTKLPLGRPGEGDPAAELGRGDVALAAALGLALGCGEDHLRQALAGVAVRA